MTPETFLQNLLAAQNLSDQQEKDLQAHKKEVTDFLRAKFGNDPVIKYAGSREKGTMICDKYDLDAKESTTETCGTIGIKSFEKINNPVVSATGLLIYILKDNKMALRGLAVHGSSPR
jgi:uncharacterized protein YunC (DUF1805 family)